jgi:hypothetical protein
VTGLKYQEKEANHASTAVAHRLLKRLAMTTPCPPIRSRVTWLTLPLLSLLSLHASGCAVTGGADDGTGKASPKDPNPPLVPTGDVRDDPTETPEERPWLFLNRSEDLFAGLSKADFSQTYGAPGDGTEEKGSVKDWDTPIKNQGSRPWCTAFATVGAIENLIQHGFGETVNLSEIDHWNAYQQYSVYASVKTAASTLIVPEDSWPYWGSPIASYRSTAVAKIGTYKNITTRAEVLAAIVAGHPVVVGTDLTSSWSSVGSDGRISSSGYIIGGHAMVVVGYQADASWPGGGYLTFRNSWGTRWGDLGYAKVPYDYCTKIGCYFLEVKDVVYKGKTPSPTPGPAPSPTPTPPPDQPTASSFTCEAVHDPASPDRFMLHVTGDAKALGKVAQVTYDTHPTFGSYEFYTVRESAEDGFQTPFYYRTYAHHWQTNGCAVKLADGTTLNVKGAVIDW